MFSGNFWLLVVKEKIPIRGLKAKIVEFTPCKIPKILVLTETF